MWTLDYRLFDMPKVPRLIFHLAAILPQTRCEMLLIKRIKQVEINNRFMEIFSRNSIPRALRYLILEKIPRNKFFFFFFDADGRRGANARPNKRKRAERGRRRTRVSCLRIFLVIFSVYLYCPLFIQCPSVLHGRVLARPGCRRRCRRLRRCRPASPSLLTPPPIYSKRCLLSKKFKAITNEPRELFTIRTFGSTVYDSIESMNLPIRCMQMLRACRGRGAPPRNSRSDFSCYRRRYVSPEPVAKKRATPPVLSPLRALICIPNYPLANTPSRARDMLLQSNESPRAYRVPVSDKYRLARSLCSPHSSPLGL
ncbi:hypothetical protein PUN28_014239 [Cardiocondyla obscurior]|uniref:Uncharacterized protein n=1 Tax=Cardiocondyla obscurior TaxID=286306 RepID=A0AAW2F3D3_9HYME